MSEYDHKLLCQKVDIFRFTRTTNMTYESTHTIDKKIEWSILEVTSYLFLSSKKCKSYYDITWNILYRWISIISRWSRNKEKKNSSKIVNFRDEWVYSLRSTIQEADFLYASYPKSTNFFTMSESTSEIIDWDLSRRLSYTNDLLDASSRTFLVRKNIDTLVITDTFSHNILPNSEADH